MEDVDIRKPLYLGVLPYGGDRYALFLNVTSEIERIVKDNVRWVRREVLQNFSQFILKEILSLAKKENIPLEDKFKIVFVREIPVIKSLEYLKARYSHASKKKLAETLKRSGTIGKWYKKVDFGGEWDYKKRHPVFSKSQSQKDCYSKYFVYAKAPNKLITYDFLGNYNYAVTGMYALTGIEWVDKIGVDIGNIFFGGVRDKKDDSAVNLGKKLYKQYI